MSTPADFDAASLAAAQLAAARAAGVPRGRHHQGVARGLPWELHRPYTGLAAALISLSTTTWLVIAAVLLLITLAAVLAWSLA